MKKRGFICWLLVLALLLAGCGPTAVQPSESAPATPAVTQIPEPTPEPTSEPTPDTGLPELKNSAELQAWLKEQVLMGAVEMRFRFTGNSSILDPQTLAEVVGAIHLTIDKIPEVRKGYVLTVTSLPGDRIVEAFRSGDVSGLTEEEQQVLAVAWQMVEEAKAAHSDPVELERGLHDALCGRVTYSEAKNKVPASGTIPRHMSVIGALLDGEASSYGYADAFYTLASMAGFEADRMYVYKYGASQFASLSIEMVNIICLEGSWYVVDASYNDTTAAGADDPLLFNAGYDAELVYNWSEAQEKRPVSLLRYDRRGESLPDSPVIGDLIGLRDYINENLDRDVTVMTFEYAGGASDLEEYQISAIARGNAVALKSIGEKTYCLYVLERPGYRIVDAYFSGDTSALSGDEIATLEMAVDMVEDAKAKATSQLDLERRLHDMLVEHMVYDSGTAVLDVYGVERNLSVIGALLDGLGNCQSYTDAFYTLASMAGFTVGKMVVDAPDPGNHICNTILLDGKWYVVDVTWDDPVNYDGPVTHYHFNAGKDLMQYSYTWREIMEYHPIEEKSNPDYLVPD